MTTFTETQRRSDRRRLLHDFSPGGAARVRKVAVALPVLLLTWPCSAEAQWAFEAFLGDAVSASSPLTVRQAGQPTVSFTAHYETRPMEPSVYYALRLSRWWGRWGGFIGYVHHKLYLSNPTPEVQAFKVTFGYNLGGVGVGYLAGPWGLLASVGPVVSNPASTVRGKEYNHTGGVFGSGNYVNGVNVQAGVNRRFYLVHWGFFSADLRLSAAWSRQPVAEGSADTPNYAIHLLLGLGVGTRPGQAAP